MMSILKQEEGLIYFRLDYAGVKDCSMNKLLIFGVSKSKDALDKLISAEKEEPFIGTKMDNAVIYENVENFVKDLTREGVFNHVFDMSIPVYTPSIWNTIPPEKQKAFSNFFHLPPKVAIIPELEPEPKPPEPEFTKIEKPKTEEYLIKPKPEGFDAFRELMNNKNISVLLIDKKDEADRKRIRFTALGFEVLYFPYKDKFIVLISTDEFKEDILKLIRDAIREYLKTDVSVEIGLPEVEGPPEEPFRPNTPELSLKAIQQTSAYKREILKEEVQNVMILYPILWDNFLNLCVEYDEQENLYYELRKDFSRTIRGITIFTRGLTKLVKREGDTSFYESRSEDPKHPEKVYHVKIQVKGGRYVLDSDEPDRINEVVTGITIDGKRIVQKFITKHMVSALIIETYGEWHVA